MASPQLTIDQLQGVIEAAGTKLALIGGQAVALWAGQYAKELSLEEPVTSKDIDFWGDRSAVYHLAKQLDTKPHFPHWRLRTVLCGMIQLRINDELVKVDVLRRVPGLGGNAWNTGTVIIETPQRASIRTLAPVALIASKFYNLKNFDQTDRQDCHQLRLCLRIARVFLESALATDVRAGLSGCQRLIKIACLGSNQQLIQSHSLTLFDAIPIEAIRNLCEDDSLSAEERSKAKNFVTIRWEQLRANGFVF